MEQYIKAVKRGTIDVNDLVLINLFELSDEQLNILYDISIGVAENIIEMEIDRRYEIELASLGDIQRIF